MIKVAKECGAGLVKGQLFNAEDDKGKPHYDWVKSHELTFDQAKELFDYGESIGIEVFYSVFGVKYVEWCEKIGVKRYKLACEFRDKEVIRAIYETKKPLVISTKSELSLPFEIPNQLFILFCMPEYPAKIKFMPYFKDDEYYPYYDGFSDHTIGLDAAKIALSRYAQIIEKHFVLEHNSNFPDNDWAMKPAELMELVRFEKVVMECL